VFLWAASPAQRYPFAQPPCFSYSQCCRIVTGSHQHGKDRLTFMSALDNMVWQAGTYAFGQCLT